MLSNQFERSAPFEVLGELTNNPNELSLYSSICFSNTMNPYTIISPLVFTTIVNGGSLLVSISFVVSLFKSSIMLDDCPTYTSLVFIVDFP